MKVLFITKVVEGDLFKTRSAGGLACRYRNLQLLQKIYGEANVFCCCVVAAEAPPPPKNVVYFREDFRLFKQYISYLHLRDGLTKKTERLLIDEIRKGQPELVFFDGSTWGRVVEQAAPGRQIVSFFHNIEKQYTGQKVIRESLLIFPRYLANWYCERKQVKFSQRCICLNERDEQLLRRYYRRGADLILPITFTDSYRPTVVTPGKSWLLFVGSNFSANTNGLLWYVKNVFPHINYPLKIVGRGMEQLKDKIHQDGIEIIGEVDDLAPYYNEADGVIAPIFTGGGMKVKTAEAMMYGKTVFGTGEAFEGYRTDGIEDLHLCETAEDFIAAINRYDRLGEPTKMNQAVRRLFLEAYETGHYENKLKQMLERKGNKFGKK